jgi:hypothetical protein
LLDGSVLSVLPTGSTQGFGDELCPGFLGFEELKTQLVSTVSVGYLSSD